MRGTKNLPFKIDDAIIYTDREDWRYHLEHHWDINPWVYIKEIQKGEPRMYQSLIALVDCHTETGGFETVPCCTLYLPTWVENHKQSNFSSVKHTQIPSHDPICKYFQRITIRKGDCVIWDSGQAHTNYPNYSSEMRLVQYVRMLPADNLSLNKHPGASPNTVSQKQIPNIKFTPLGLKLMAFDKWEDTSKK